MGLKSGSRDAGLEDGSEDETTETETEAAPSEAGGEATSTDADEGQSDAESSVEASDEGASEDRSGRPSMESIPYKLRRDKVNEGRQQVPYFLRDDVIEAEDDLQDALEAMVGESVYKSDYREAAMVVAQRNPELVAEVLREWGYDLD